VTLAAEPTMHRSHLAARDVRVHRVLRGALLLGSILVALGLLPVALPSPVAAALLGAGCALGVPAGVWLFLRRDETRRPSGDAQDHLVPVRDLIASDPVMTLLTNRDGRVFEANAAVRARMRRDRWDAEPGALRDLLHLLVADPDVLLDKVQAQLDASGAGWCRESVVTRRGAVVLTARIVGTDRVLWRVEERACDGMPSDAATVSWPRLKADPEGRVLLRNDAARRLFGDHVATLAEISDTPLDTGTTLEVRSGEADRTFLVACLQTADGCRDIWFLQVPAASPQSDAIAPVFDRLLVPLLEVSQRGRIQRANVEALRLLESDDLAGVSLGDVLEGLGRSVPDWLSDVASGRTQNTTEFLRVSTGTKERFVQVTLKPMAGGDPPNITAVLNDATELKTLEAQFVQSQKMQAIGQLAGGVAHDFNNLLTAISGHCDLLLLRHDQGDPDYGDLVQINQNANRAAALVNQLLAFSRKQTLRPELLDLRDTLSDLTHLLNRLVGEKVTLQLTHDDNLRPVRVDKRQFEQVMMNLVVNARDAMPDGGRIVITTDVVHLRSPLQRDRAVVAPGEYICVKVTDAGVGIAPDKLQKVFEPFYTTKRAGEGTGLGLSTVYGIVKQTGGFIFVDSVVGEGTSFTLMFPVHEVETVAAPAEPVRHQSHGVECTNAVVLLVEDEAPVRAFASRALRLRGFTVLEAQSAEEALETLEDPTLKIDVFVTDVVMPGMDGPRWVRKALEARPDTRVVFVSGYAEESFGSDQTRIPNSVFLPKPFSLSELTETVQGQLQ